jgi:twitching motility protein PilI
MARVSLRDYQRQLAERLKDAGAAGTAATKLGVQVGASRWLVDLNEAGEVIPVPPITPVPLTRPWFRGVTNIRGNLYSVVDFPAFLGGKPVGASHSARLLLISERFRTAAALLVDGSLGLRNPAQLTQREAEGARAAWTRAEYADSEGQAWTELDVPHLIQHPDFLGVAM